MKKPGTMVITSALPHRGCPIVDLSGATSHIFMPGTEQIATPHQCSMIRSLYMGPPPGFEWVFTKLVVEPAPPEVYLEFFFNRRMAACGPLATFLGHPFAMPQRLPERCSAELRLSQPEAPLPKEIRLVTVTLHLDDMAWDQRRGKVRT